VADTENKDWQWLIFKTSAQQNTPDVAMEVNNSIDDFVGGFPKMIRGRNLCGVAIGVIEGKLHIKVLQDPTCKDGGIVLYDSACFTGVIVPDAEIKEKLGTAIGRQSLFKPDPLETQKINSDKKTFETLKGGKA
jgi:hypothetical protein